MGPSHHLRARLVFALAVSLALVLGCSLPALPGSAPKLPALSGRLAWPDDGDLAITDLATKQEQKLTQLPQELAVSGAAFSPDSQQIVYGEVGPRPGDKASGGDLMLIGADGSNAHVWQQREGPSIYLETPQWMPSGEIYFGRRDLTGPDDLVSIWRQTENGSAEKIVDNGFNPGLTPDESTLVYEKLVGENQEMDELDLRTGSSCILLPASVFPLLDLPRVSPDGTRIAFAGSGTPGTGSGTCSGSSQSAIPPQVPAALTLAGFFGPGTAYAHGLPWDAYVINVDGSGFQKLATVQDDDPNVAWSPDGTLLAIFALGGMSVVDGHGGTPVKFLPSGGYGGISWSP